MKPLVYAHRGSHLGFCRENSLPAFREAVAMGVDGVETDVRHTRDARLAIYHDDTVAGRPVETMTLDELSEAASMRVPTLDDLLSLDRTAAWNLEIKTREAWCLMRPMIAALPEGTLITSFIHDIPASATRDHGLEAGLLTASASRDPVDVARGGLRTCVFDARILDVETASAWHAGGWRLATYGTVGGARHAAAMALRPTILITDEIELALRMRMDIPS